jgi:hypothetical protein
METGENVAVKKVLQDKRFKVHALKMQSALGIHWNASFCKTLENRCPCLDKPGCNQSILRREVLRVIKILSLAQRSVCPETRPCMEGDDDVLLSQAGVRTTFCTA